MRRFSVCDDGPTPDDICFVMPGLVHASRVYATCYCYQAAEVGLPDFGCIRVFGRSAKEGVDGRDKPGHDQPQQPAFVSMTIALPAETMRRPARFDLSWPILILFAAALCVLILLPMSWLVYFSLTDRSGALTLDNFRRLFSDPVFVDPLITTVITATASSVICCVVAAPMGWLVARTDMPLRRTVRALVTASFVTPPFLGAIAWELLAAPNSGLINKAYRALTGAPQDEYLFNIYSLPGLIFVISCYTFPYVFVLIANALDRIPGDLEDASAILGGRTWTTARRVTIPLAMPALIAGVLVAFLQAMTLFGSPAILALPAGFHTMTTKIWSLFQYPPKPELAAAASLPLLVLTVLLLRAEHAILGRRGYSVVGGKQGDPRLIRLGRGNWVALALVFGVLLCPVFLPYAALFNAAFSRVASQFIWFNNFTFHNIEFVFFELSATKLAVKNTFLLGTLSATIGTLMALVISYMTARRAITGYRALGFLATAPVAIPGIVLGVGLFLSYTRPPFVLYGTLWILLIAFVTIALPSAYQQMQSAFRSVHTDLEDASRILGATRLRTLRDITAPLLRTSVIATWCFIFVGVIRELSAAIMLFTSETKVISVLIFDLNESGDLGAIAVLGLIMLIITFAVVIAVNRIPGFGGVRLRNT
jgi:iron(III) transport system permease protein